jgi:oligoribonuclease
MTSQLSKPLVWMDLEMTGLDPDRHVIVEVAVILTDGTLEHEIEGPQLILSASEEELAEMDDVVIEMHSTSGLLEAIKESTLPVAEAEQLVLAFLKEHIEEGVRAPLAGNSVHADRHFLLTYMPELAAYLHYRIVDVTSFKEVAARWYPDFEGSPPEKAGGHRALVDIRESIEELRYYRETFFKQGPLEAATEPQSAASEGNST